MCLVLPVSAIAQTPTDSTPNNVAVTRWVDPTGSKPLTAREWLREHPPSDLRTEIVRARLGRRGTLLFLVSQEMWDLMAATFQEYVDQVESEGWGVTATTVQGGTAASLRDFIAAQDPQPSGVFMVGNLPVAWFQILDGFNERGERGAYEEFPIDLYFMDLNGTWEDLYTHTVGATGDTLIPGPDGIFDGHTGWVTPEVSVGRLDASTISWAQEDALLENYFAKNLAYRRGGLRLPRQGLSYVDDDWSTWTTVGLDSLYDDVTVINAPNVTRAADYRPRLLEGYEWVSVFVHSWPRGHSFKYDNGQSWESFYAWDLFHSMDAKANFYNLFACSNARYTDANYMSGVYVMAGTWGLGAVGSTKSGSMLSFEDFYEPLGEGATLGDAYLQWFQAMAWNGFEPWERAWFYGMTLTGDPTLLPSLPEDLAPPSAVTDLSITAVGDSVWLSWSPAHDDLWLDHYVVYRFDHAHAEVGPADSVATTSETSYGEEPPLGFLLGTYYMVRARDGAGNLAADSNRVGSFGYLLDAPGDDSAPDAPQRRRSDRP